jgi:quercetin dioxygenase-like cupin family protein/heme-degrading monooxygenase HmoA
MESIDLKSREVFGDEGRGVAILVDEPTLKIRQIGLEPGKYVPLHIADAPVTLQVVHGEGVFSADGQSLRMGPGKLLRIPQGASMGIANTSAAPLVFLVIKTPLAEEAPREEAMGGRVSSFVNIVDFAPPKPGKQDAFLGWFRRSNEIFAQHPGFISRTLLGPIEGGTRYAAVIEHESKETFMDMQLSDDREELFQQVEPLLLGPSKPLFYELLVSFRKNR